MIIQGKLNFFGADVDFLLGIFIINACKPLKINVMSKQKEGTPYVGGMILGTIPQDLLESGSLRVDPDETVIAFSDEASRFLENQEPKFHKKSW